MNIEKNAAQQSKHDVLLAAAPKEVSLAKELKALVQAAQQGQQEAIDRLCDKFKWLVKREAHLSYVEDALGEDAENTAWKYFLEVVLSYNQKSFLQFPGYLQKSVRFYLYNEVHRNNSVRCTSTLDATDENGNSIQIEDHRDNINELLQEIDINLLLSQLAPKQREVIQETLLKDNALKDYSSKRGIAYKVAYCSRKTAIKRIKELLNKK